MNILLKKTFLVATFNVVVMVFVRMTNKSGETIWIANVVVQEPKKYNLSLQGNPVGKAIK